MNRQEMMIAISSSKRLEVYKTPLYTQNELNDNPYLSQIPGCIPRDSLEYMVDEHSSNYDLYDVGQLSFVADGYIRYSRIELYAYYSVEQSEAELEIQIAKKTGLWAQVKSHDDVPTLLRTSRKKSAGTISCSLEPIHVFPVNHIVFDAINDKIKRIYSSVFKTNIPTLNTMLWLKKDKIYAEQHNHSNAEKHIDRERVYGNLSRLSTGVSSEEDNITHTGNSSHSTKPKPDGNTGWQALVEQFPILHRPCPYKVLSAVGSGSYGQAVLVKNVNNEKQYVMKTVDVSKLSERGILASLGEARFLHLLRHPFIVALHDAFLIGNVLCIILENCTGGDLFRLVQLRKQQKWYLCHYKGFPERQVSMWLAQITLALLRIHSRNIIHRDIKSSNIFIDEFGNAQLADFGVSCDVNDAKSTITACIGTPFYLSPEILSNMYCTKAADIWALGCVLHELCRLKMPYPSEDLQVLQEVVVNQPPPSLPSKYSEELRALHLRMLDKNHRTRITAEEMVNSNYIQSVLKKNYPEAAVDARLIDMRINQNNIANASYTQKLVKALEVPFKYGPHLLNENPHTPIRLETSNKCK